MARASDALCDRIDVPRHAEAVSSSICVRLRALRGSARLLCGRTPPRDVKQESEGSAHGEGVRSQSTGVDAIHNPEGGDRAAGDGAGKRLASDTLAFFVHGSPIGARTHRWTRVLPRFDRLALGAWPGVRRTGGRPVETGFTQSTATGTTEHVRSTDDLGARLAQLVGSTDFARYFAGQTSVRSTTEGLEVAAASGFLAKALERRFGQALKTLAQMCPTGVVRFVVDPNAQGSTGSVTGDPAHAARTQAPQARASSPNPATAPARPASFAAMARPASPRPARPQPGSVSPRATDRPVERTGEASRQRFETFVVGESNRMAHAAAWAVACGESPLVFIHGTCGVGKTHLMRAIAHEALRRNPSGNVRCTTAEAFTNEFIQAVRSNKVDAFRKQYRKCDVLCIDDVHFLASKEATQQELLHTLDAAGLSGTRVALACDEHPREVAKFNERLVSRFLSGPVVRIDAPDASLRAELIRHLAVRRGLNLEPAAAALVAERAATAGARHNPASVRELEGMLIQIEAVRTLLPELTNEETGSDRRVGVLLVRKALGLSDQAPTPRAAKRPIPVPAILETVCECVGAPVVEVMGKSRHQRVVLARSMASHLARRLTTMSFPEIARAMGRPNHSTIITAQKRLEREMSRPDGGRIDWLDGPSRGLSLRELADELALKIQRAHA